MPENWNTKTKWIKIDAWRGYYQPIYAVAGVSDTGRWSDSPAPSDEVVAELKKLKKYLNSKNISTREKITKSSNVFMVKRWIVVKPSDYKIAKNWLMNG